MLPEIHTSKTPVALLSCPPPSGISVQRHNDLVQMDKGSNPVATPTSTMIECEAVRACLLSPCAPPSFMLAVVGTSWQPLNYHFIGINNIQILQGGTKHHFQPEFCSLIEIGVWHLLATSGLAIAGSDEMAVQRLWGDIERGVIGGGGGSSKSKPALQPQLLTATSGLSSRVIWTNSKIWEILAKSLFVQKKMQPVLVESIIDHHYHLTTQEHRYIQLHTKAMNHFLKGGCCSNQTRWYSHSWINHGSSSGQQYLDLVFLN